MKTTGTHGYIVLVALAALATIASVLLLVPNHSIAQEPVPQEEKVAAENPIGKSVIVYLDTMRVDLRDGTSTVKTFPIVSKGKPGSYYETPGGTYENDYKSPLHFSSFGHVYMPYSTHIFGNFFIHGIPYYPDGERVSSNYSGGCIRLEDNDAESVYKFIEKGTPIVIAYEHEPEVTGDFIPKEKMSRLMVAVISLEFLPQDGSVMFDGKETTRLELLDKLLSGNEAVALFYAKEMGTERFIKLMNEKAKAIGLTETTFTSIGEMPQTSGKDLMLFYAYLKDYKSYLLNRDASTTAIAL